MRFLLRLNGARLRNWHLQLVERLKAVPGLEVAVELVDGGAPPPRRFENLLRLEAVLHGWPRTGLAATLPRQNLQAFIGPDAAAAALTLDLTGAPPVAPGRIWCVTFNGSADETALLSILLAGGTPLVAIVEGDAVVATGRIGTEYGGMLLAAFEDILARLTTLIVAAVAGGGQTALPQLPTADGGSAPPPAPDAARLAVVAARKVAGVATRQLYRLCCHTPHWRTGWRKLGGGPDLLSLRAHPETGWQDLPDDGHRFYADPFPILHEGAVTLFVEDYDHRVGKGIISAARFDENGPIEAPVPVLEQPGHLSYPFVFARDGEVWMIPESCSAGTVDLFRATAFPGGWVKEATLISGLAASDATLVEKDGRWWLFATVRDGGGAFSDTLHLWSAPDFRGPWTAHPRNPVLIDIASARPAGRMVWRDGTLLRPVQDCRRGYGAALGIARVTRLDEGGYAQVVETILGPGPLWRGRRLHTLNSAGGFEFIDGSSFARRRSLGGAA